MVAVSNVPQTAPMRGGSAQVIPWHGNRVLKLFDRGFPAEAIRAEFLNAQAAAALGIDTPRAEEIVRINDREGIVFERRAGVTLYDVLVSGAKELEALVDVFFALQRSIHVQPCSAFPGMVERLRRNIRCASDVPDTSRSLALQLLETCDTSVGLCHGDFHPLNVLLTPAGAVVIDWLDASQGHPAADMARTLLLLEFGRAGHGDEVVRAAFLRAYRRRCEEVFPREVIDTWRLPVLIARLAEPLGRRERQTLTGLLHGQIA